MQTLTVPKNKFKAKALAYLRMVEEKNEPIVVTHQGKPVVKVIPIQKKTNEKIFEELSDAIISYGDLVSPVGVGDWEALK